jgi:hypothetical protein
MRRIKTYRFVITILAQLVFDCHLLLCITVDIYLSSPIHIVDTLFEKRFDSFLVLKIH